MRDYAISCCSTVDLNAALLRENEVHCLYFSYTVDGIPYRDDFGESLPLSEFYRRMTSGSSTQTTQIPTADYLDYFEEVLASGRDVLHISMSSGMSGTVRSARAAAAIAAERHPEGRVVVIDSLCESCGYGMLVLEAARLRRKGVSLDRTVDWIEKNKMRMEHWFFSTDLTYSVRGGRVSRAEGFIDGLLGICPVMSVDAGGRMVLRARARSRHRALSDVVSRMERYASDSLSYKGRCCISHSAVPDAAEQLARRVQDRFRDLDGGVSIHELGTVAGCHSGPGTVALFFWGDGRVPGAARPC